MVFKVKTSNGTTVTLTPLDLCEILSAEIQKKGHEDGQEISQAFTFMLSQGEVLYRTSLMEYGWLSFLAGYYYRIFLEKNDVTIEQEETDVSTPETSPESSPPTEVSG